MKFKEYIKEIEASNEVFKKATKAEKRVMIAQDTIERIKSKQLLVQSGEWCNLEYDIRHDNNDKSFKEVLNSYTTTPVCTVCAKGGLFASYIGRVNKVSVFESHIGNGSSEDSILHKKLLELFSFSQIDLIEIAFEGRSYISKCENEKLVKKAMKFHQDFPLDTTDDDILIAICENIIENNGTFQP